VVVATLLSLGMLACSRPRGAGPQQQRGDATPPPAISPTELARRLAVPLESLRAAGEELYGRQAYDSARLVLDVEAVRASAAGDGPAEARARMWAGLAAWRLGDYAAARSQGEAAVALKRRLGLDAELSRSYNALGLLTWNEGRLHEARVWFDSATAAARRHDDAAGLARAAANIPLVLTQLGDYDGARRGFLEAIAAGAARGDARLEGNALANLAMLEIRLGEPAVALRHLDDARERYARIDYGTGEANALGQAATAWADLGELQRAIAAANDGLELARRRGLRQEMAAALEVLADLHYQAGDLRRALSILTEADSLDRALGLTVERGTNLRRQGEILFALGEVAVGAQRAREALAVHAGTDDRNQRLLDALLLAELLSREGDRVAAGAAVDSARATARGLGSAARRAVAVTATQLALDGGDARGALRELDALPRADAGDGRVLDLRAAALLARGNLRGARAASEAAVTSLERERGSLDLGPLRAGFLGARIAPLARLIDIRLRQGDTTGAFELAASVAGRGLVEHLQVSGDAEPATLAAVGAGARLLRRIGALEVALDTLGEGAGTAEARTALERALSEARRAYDEHLSHVGSLPRAGMLGLAPPSLAVVQAALHPDELLLLSLAGPERLDLFALRRGSLAHYAVPLGERELAERVRVARAALLERPGTEPPEPLRELGHLLLGAVESSGMLDGARRIVIVPHGPLSALPFAALWLSGRGQYLVERVAVVVVPSAGVLPLRPAEPAGAAALSLFAPLADSLQGTGRETRAIARLVHGTTLRLGAAADEAAVRAALESGQMVHIASHGTLDASNPMFSMVRVHRGAATGQAAWTNDGRLEAHELLRMRVRSPLVFLSGCETGLTANAVSPLGGAEEGSLAQALLYAGAQAVVATLWRVDDREAVALAEGFYRHLSAADPGEALALAQREALADRRSFTWAAYTLAGLPGAKTATPIRISSDTP
jgi:CHAT domain-containing protein